MGADGDYNNDGRLDFYTTNYQGELPMLLHNLGGVFEDLRLRTGAGAGCYNYVNWGCGLVDFDNDGYKDIFVCNGHTEDNIELRDPTTGYRCYNVLLWNNGQGKFIDVSCSAACARWPSTPRRVSPSTTWTMTETSTW